MQFEKAKKGLGRIIASYLLLVISSLLIAVGGAIGVLADENEGLILAAGLLILFGLLVQFAAFIVKLVGLVQASKDENNFRVGLWVVLFSILMNLVSIILSWFVKDIPYLDDIFKAISGICDLAVTVLVISGAANLMDRQGEDLLRDKGENITKFIIFMYGLSIIFSLFPSFFLNPSDVLSAIFTALLLIAGIIEVVVFVGSLLYLRKVRSMLK